MTCADVLAGSAGSAKWGVDCADAIEWLRALPDDSIDLLVTSPPYERARTYGISKSLPAGQDWVDWMVSVVRAAAPKVRGLIAVNCEGQTRGYRYSCVPFLLMADLHRAGFNLRKPPVFHRVGIPGSGGPDWLRNDYEPIVCVTRPGKLPWSNNTACGHLPKWAPGGEMSYRLSDGTKRNKFGMNGTQNARSKNGERKRMNTGKRADRPHTKREANGDMQVQGYNVPVMANPGNSIERTYTASEVAAMLAEQSDLLSINVGGGQMGHAAAHDNEAPFPVELPAFFVKSFCPPDGVTCDPFTGSGTTCQAAVENGRRFIGCDVRQSQVELTRRRMGTITLPLFAS